MPIRIFFLLFVCCLPAHAASFTDSPHGRIHYEFSDTAQGVPVILVHGFSTPMWVWDPLVTALKDNNRSVLRFDLYGRGKSDRAKSGDTLAVFHEELDSLRTALGLHDPFDLVGLSMGGAIAASYTAKYPSKVRKLVLIAPFSQPKKLGFLTNEGIGEWVMQKIYVPVSLNWGYRRSFFDANGFMSKNPDIKKKFENRTADQDYALALLSSLRNIITKEQLHWYEKVGEHQTPTMLIWGEQDNVIPHDQSGQIRETLGQTEFLSVPESGHLPHLERDDFTSPEIVSFLEGN